MRLPLRPARAVAAAALLLLAATPAGAQGDGLPPDVAERVAGCAAVAVSANRVTAVGCANGGIVMVRRAVGAPPFTCHARANRAKTRPRKCGALGTVVAPMAPAAPSATTPSGNGGRRNGGAPTGTTGGDATGGRQCHPAYGGCLPYEPGDAYDCGELGDPKVQVFDPANDPYNLDAVNRVGNGTTCDDIG